jgi:hypothetical protein
MLTAVRPSDIKLQSAVFPISDTQTFLISSVLSLRNLNLCAATSKAVLHKRFCN